MEVTPVSSQQEGDSVTSISEKDAVNDSHNGFDEEDSHFDEQSIDDEKIEGVSGVRTSAGVTTSCVWQHFVYDKTNNRTACHECDYSCQGRFATTLIRHLSKHPERYELFLEAELRRDPNRSRDISFLLRYRSNDYKNPAVDQAIREMVNASRKSAGSLAVDVEQKKSPRTPKRVSRFGDEDEEDTRRSKKPKSNITVFKAPVSASKDGSYVTIEVINSKSSKAKSRTSTPNRVTVSSVSPAVRTVSRTMVEEVPDNAVDEEVNSSENRKRKFRNMLTELLLTSNVNPNLIENDVFRKMISFLDPKIHLPSRETVLRQVTETHKEVKQEMKDLLASATQITIGADVCERKTVTKNMLAITAYFYNREERRRCVLSLALRELPVDGTEEGVIKHHIDSVLKDYGIQKKQLFRCLTGTGGRISNDNDIIVDESEQPSVFLNVHFCDQNPEQCTSGCYANTFRVLSSGTRAKKLACFVYILDSVWKPYERKSCFDQSVAVASKLIQALKKAGTNISFMLDDDGKPIKTPRRWVPLFCKIQHLVRSKLAIENLCNEYGIEKLSAQHWDRLDKYTQLLGPFKLIRDQQDNQEEATISRVIPGIIFLDSHLNHQLIHANDTEVHQTANELLFNLRTKTNYLLNPGSEGFDEIYLAATCLDPSVHSLLNQDQINIGYNFLKELSNDYEVDEENSDTEAAKASSFISFDSIAGPPKKNVRTSRGNKRGKPIHQYFKDDDDSNLFDEFLANNMNRGAVACSKLDKELAEWTQFVAQKTVSSKTGGIEFWTKNPSITGNFPLLKKIAVDVLSVPSNAYDIENIFVTAGHVCEGKRIRVSAENLESQVLLRTNRPFLKIFADDFD